MPNWCEGSLRLRGDYDDVMRFFKEGVNVYTYDPKTQGNVVAIDKEKYIEIEEYSNEDTFIDFSEVDGFHTWLYVENTRRAFITERPSLAVIIKHADVATSVVGIKQAWSFDVDDWTAISEKYNLELKLYGIESGLGFFEEFWIKNGHVVKENSAGVDKNGDYSEFIWNCPFPWMGG